MRSEWRQSAFEHTQSWYDDSSECTRAIQYEFLGDFVELDDGSHCPKEFTVVQRPDDESLAHHRCGV